MISLRFKLFKSFFIVFLNWISGSCGITFCGIMASYWDMVHKVGIADADEVNGLL